MNWILTNLDRLAWFSNLPYLIGGIVIVVTAIIALAAAAFLGVFL